MATFELKAKGNNTIYDIEIINNSTTANVEFDFSQGGPDNSPPFTNPNPKSLNPNLPKGNLEPIKRGEVYAEMPLGGFFTGPGYINRGNTQILTIESVSGEEYDVNVRWWGSGNNQYLNFITDANSDFNTVENNDEIHKVVSKDNQYYVTVDGGGVDDPSTGDIYFQVSGVKQNIDFFNDRLADWMSWLNPEKKLSEIVIPGSHDAGSYTMTDWQNELTGTGDFFAQTQDATGWIDQLNAGVRYFDLRVEDNKGTTIIHHGIIKGEPLKNQIEQFKEFIDQHPNEFIILDFQEIETANLNPNSSESLQQIFKVLDIENTGLPSNKNLADVTLDELWSANDNFAIVIRDGTYEDAINKGYELPDWMFKRSEALQSPFDGDIYGTWNPTKIIPYVEGKASEWEQQGKPTLLVAQDIGSGGSIHAPIEYAWEPFSNQNNYSNGFNDWPKELVENPAQPVNIVMRDFTNWLPETIANILEANIPRGNVQNGKEDEFNERLLEAADFAALSPFQANPTTQTIAAIRNGETVIWPTNVLESYKHKANSTLSQGYWDDNYPNIPRESAPYTIEIGAQGLPNAQDENTIEIVGNDFLGKNKLLNIPLQADAGEEVISWVKITSVAGAKNDGTFYGFGDGWVFQDSLDFHLFGNKNNQYSWKIEYETIPISTLNSDFFSNSNEPETNPNNLPTFNFTGQANSPLKLVQHQATAEIIVEEDGSFYFAFEPHAINNAIVNGVDLEAASDTISALAALFTDDGEADVSDDLITAETALDLHNGSRETHLLALMETITIESNGELIDLKEIIQESLANNDAQLFKLPGSETEGIMVKYEAVNESPFAGSVLVDSEGEVKSNVTIDLGVVDLDQDFETTEDQAIAILVKDVQDGIASEDTVLLKLNNLPIAESLEGGEKAELVYAAGHAATNKKIVIGTIEDDDFDSVVPDKRGFDGDGQILFTGSGNDIVDVQFAPGNNRIDLGSDDDLIYAGVNNRIILASGDDIIFFVGEGNNVVTGGAGADQFWLLTDENELPVNPNIITDFSDEDVLGFANSSLDFAALTISQNGSDTNISVLQVELATLLNFEAASLTADNFVFA